MLLKKTTFKFNTYLNLLEQNVNSNANICQNNGDNFNQITLVV